jgi:hypothetical protein
MLGAARCEPVRHPSKNSPSRIRTTQSLSGKTSGFKEGGPKSGPNGGVRHQLASASTACGLDELASQLASLSQADWAALLAMMPKARESIQ